MHKKYNTHKYILSIYDDQQNSVSFYGKKMICDV